MVEMEDRRDERGCRADLCAAGPWPARQPVQRLYFRRIEQTAGNSGSRYSPVCQGLLLWASPWREMGEVDAIIRKTTRESFGPVRSPGEHLF